MHIDDCLFYLINGSAKRASRFWKAAVGRFAVTGTQAITLIALMERDKQTAAELMERCNLDSATLSGLLDRLERDGFVLREKNASDGRSILVCLTDRGRTIGAGLTEAMVAANDELASRFSPEELGQLKVLLQKI